MKSNIHPNYKLVLAKCVCGHEFHFYAALEVESINIEVCNECHPFYTGTQKAATVTGRVENFNNKFQKRKQNIVKPTTTDKPTKEKKSRK
ncbi:MAG: 50S ribosomal protein L31 [Gammaproteobacteria bacterium]|jgi:large subunit ribosomal protein L31